MASNRIRAKVLVSNKYSYIDPERGVVRAQKDDIVYVTEQALNAFAGFLAREDEPKGGAKAASEESTASEAKSLLDDDSDTETSKSGKSGKASK